MVRDTNPVPMGPMEPHACAARRTTVTKGDQDRRSGWARTASRLGDDRGMVSVEAAFAIAAIVSALIVGVGAILAVGAHVRCVDAAREAARIAAQGDSARATSAGRSVAPGGADITIRVEGDRVVATVRAELDLLPGVDLGATAVAAMEPVSADDP